VARGIASLSVVMSHSLPPFRSFLLVYNIPVFFVISGIFVLRASQKLSFPEFFKRRVVSLYIPFLKIAVFFLLAHNALAFLGANPRFYEGWDFARQAVRIAAFSTGNDEVLIRSLWFLKALFVSELIFFAISRLKGTLRNMVLVVSILLGWALTYILPSSSSLKTILVIPLIALFFLASGEWLLAISKRLIPWHIAILMVIVAVFASFYKMNLVELKLYNLLIYYLGSSLGVLLVLSISNTQFWGRDMLAFLGGKTLYIAAFHVLGFTLLLRLLETTKFGNGLERENIWPALFLFGIGFAIFADYVAKNLAKATGAIMNRSLQGFGSRKATPPSPPTNLSEENKPPS